MAPTPPSPSPSDSPVVRPGSFAALAEEDDRLEEIQRVFAADTDEIFPETLSAHSGHDSELPADEVDTAGDPEADRSPSQVRTDRETSTPRGEAASADADDSAPLVPNDDAGLRALRKAKPRRAGKLRRIAKSDQSADPRTETGPGGESEIGPDAQPEGRSRPRLKSEVQIKAELEQKVDAAVRLLRGRSQKSDQQVTRPAAAPGPPTVAVPASGDAAGQTPQPVDMPQQAAGLAEATPAATDPPPGSPTAEPLPPSGLDPAEAVVSESAASSPATELFPAHGLDPAGAVVSESAASLPAAELFPADGLDPAGVVVYESAASLPAAEPFSGAEPVPGFDTDNAGPADLPPIETGSGHQPEGESVGELVEIDPAGAAAAGAAANPLGSPVGLEDVIDEAATSLPRPPSLLDSMGEPDRTDFGAPVDAFDEFDADGELDALLDELSAASGGSDQAERRRAFQGEATDDLLGDVAAVDDRPRTATVPFADSRRPPHRRGRHDVEDVVPRTGPRRVVSSKRATAGARVQAPGTVRSGSGAAGQARQPGKNRAETFASETSVFPANRTRRGDLVLDETQSEGGSWFARSTELPLLSMEDEAGGIYGPRSRRARIAGLTLVMLVLAAAIVIIVVQPFG